MSNEARTPGPWELEGCEISAVKDNAHILTWSACKRANAEFIVKACNAHDELVEALREIKKKLKGLSSDPLDYKLKELREIAHKPYYKIIDSALRQAGETVEGT